MSDQRDTYKTPEHGWVCFHCGEHFAGDMPGTQAARDHFGSFVSATPACQIWGNVTSWRSGYRRLVRALRVAENERDKIRTALSEDDTEKDRHIAKLTAARSRELRDAEEIGYARGLADGRKYPATGETR